MDNLTHTLTGAALSKAGLERLTPLATATLVLAANAPDVDVLSYLRGEYFALSFRRGITHGVPALAVLPFAVAAVVLAWDRGVRRRRDPDVPPARPHAVFGLALLGLLTHPVLDWTNSYGMRWWLPLSGRWSYGDSVFIIDPWLWLALGSAVFLSRPWSLRAGFSWGALALAGTTLVLWAPLPLAAKVIWTSWLVVLTAARVMATARVAGEWRVPAVVLTAVAALYVCALVASNALASRAVRAAGERAGLGRVDQLMVAPEPADPLGSVVLIRSGDRLVRGSHRWTRRPAASLDVEAPVPTRSSSGGVPTAEVDAAIAAAVRQQDAAHYLAWARFPYYRVAREGKDGYRVRIADARYDARGGSLAGIDVFVPGSAVRP